MQLKIGLLQDTCDTALHLAAASGRLNGSRRQECLTMLLELGACTDLVNKVPEGLSVWKA